MNSTAEVTSKEGCDPSGEEEKEGNQFFLDHARNESLIDIFSMASCPSTSSVRSVSLLGRAPTSHDNNFFVSCSLGYKKAEYPVSPWYPIPYRLEARGGEGRGGRKGTQRGGGQRASRRNLLVERRATDWWREERRVVLKERSTLLLMNIELVLPSE